MNEANYNISGEDLVRDLLLVLRETFEGSPGSEGSIYLDRGVGVLTTLGSVNAEQASQTFESTTIAAHTEHLKFYVDRLIEFIEGRTAPVNWEDSWLIETVNEDEWTALRSSVERSYRSAVERLAAVEEWKPDRIGEAIAIIAHSAYHFGAIRQMAKRV
ncbi:MAG: hypothetical protein IPM21_08910 [Acidobacteria bacterium]|nr:hypothetical protein [Acidobacteriota bacterium]